MIWRTAWAVGLVAVSATAATNGLSEAEIEGQNLVRQLIASRPPENFTNAGILRIFPRKGESHVVPVKFETFVTATNWQTGYFAQGNPANKANAGSALIIHRAQQPNEYRVWIISRPAGQTREFDVLPPDQTMTSFAGSDFWLADLGLEFLHWPEQRLLKKELRSGQSCYVLESKKPGPATNGYTRVVSWLDIDTVRETHQPAIIHADAYDARGKLLKVFEPKKLEKVNGQYQLQEMQIRNVQNGSRSRLEFQFDSP